MGEETTHDPNAYFGELAAIAAGIDRLTRTMSPEAEIPGAEADGRNAYFASLGNIGDALGRLDAAAAERLSALEGMAVPSITTPRLGSRGYELYDNAVNAMTLTGTPYPFYVPEKTEGAARRFAVFFTVDGTTPCFNICGATFLSDEDGVLGALNAGEKSLFTLLEISDGVFFVSKRLLAEATR